MKKNPCIALALGMLLALTSTTASALGEVSYTIEKVFDTVEPIFLAGHSGDPNWVAGFSFSGDIYWKGGVIGTVTGEARLWNPPLSTSDVYDNVSMHITNVINGLGTFEVYAQGTTLSSSTSTVSGDWLLSWTGSVANGTGYFDGFYGLSAGAGLSNLFTGTASATEIVILRSGF